MSTRQIQQGGEFYAVLIDLAFPGSEDGDEAPFQVNDWQEVEPVDALKAFLSFPIDIAFLSPLFRGRYLICYADAADSG